MSVFLFLVILVILIVSHEFGHFIAAKRAGIRVDEFAIGFPPRLFVWGKGETKYSFNLLPFGGFVKIFGEDPNKESIEGLDKARSFVHQKKSTQAVVVAAGVIFNLLLAWLLFAVGYSFGFPSVVTDDKRPLMKDITLMITGVSPGAPAEEAGLKAGDKIVALASGDGTISPKTPEQVQTFIGDHGNQKISITYLRGETKETLQLMPLDGIYADRPAIGIALNEVGILELPVHQAVWEGAKSTFGLTVATTAGFFYLVKKALSGDGALSDLTGPVGIVGLVGDARELGFTYLLGFTALISVNLAVINLIPFPALDGGRLLFIGIEALKGSPIKPEVANALNSVGFALLLILMVVVTYRDVAKLVTG